MNEQIIYSQFQELELDELANVNGGIIYGGPGAVKGMDMCMSFIAGFVCGIFT
ncbi:MAG: hypothetical protein E6772_11695 [Dysgonomonas sp.]|nr:hypothetical protein [Dysgonomonas sp.]